MNRTPPSPVCPLSGSRAAESASSRAAARTSDRSPRPVTPHVRFGRLAPGAWRLLVGWAVAGGLLVAVPGPALAGLPVRVAVAPFAVEGVAGRAVEPDRADLGLRVAKVLTARLGLRDPERLLPPGSFVASDELEPQAESVRRWAWQAAVEAVVVGRVARPEGAASREVVEAVLRSGHSGAELARHAVALDAVGSLDASMDRLAAALLADLGHADAPVASSDPAGSVGPSGEVPGGVAPTRDAGAGAGDARGGRRGLDADLGLSNFEKDAPIEIHAEEAEIVSHDDERLLVFQRNVRVRQANVSLRSDRLEALYRKGESEPRQLVAQGRVHVDQDGRRARCDRAVYVRDDQTLQCTGHAELVQGCDVVRGESIEFDLARDRARVEGAASIVIRPDEDGAEPGAAAGCPAAPGRS